MSDATMAQAVAAADRALTIESEAIAATRTTVRDTLPEALRVLSQRRGRVVVSGLGKSGHVGAKIAATLASTGTPAFFVHAAEALHGDSGMVTPEDVAILISHSGETAEVCHFARMLSARGVALIAMTGRPTSTLARLARVHLSIEVAREADPLGLAPTASTASTLALGDALAAGLMTLSGFTADEFAEFHPGGSLGRQLLGDGGVA